VPKLLPIEPLFITTEGLFALGLTRPMAL